MNESIKGNWIGLRFIKVTLLACAVLWSGREGMSRNLIMTFSIKKRIDTELFIDGKLELYIHKRRIKEIDRTSGREAIEIGSDVKNRWEWILWNVLNAFKTWKYLKEKWSTCIVIIERMVTADHYYPSRGCLIDYFAIWGWNISDMGQRLNPQP